MQVTAKQISHILRGEVIGDPLALIERPSKIEEARPGEITFLANPKYESFAYTTNASVILVSREFTPKYPIRATMIRVDDVYEAIACLLDEFGGEIERTEGVSTTAFVHQDAKVEENVSIGNFVVIEEGAEIGENTVIFPQVFIGKNVKIGANSILYPGAKIYHDCFIGESCILHSNVVVGSDGFGFVPQSDGTYRKVPQTGNVIIEDCVEIGSNTTIDRATMGSTIIRKGVKLDNLIMVAHNVEIDEDTVIAAQTGIAGSTKIGKRCMIGGQAGFAGHIKIANDTKIQAQSGLSKTIKEEGTAWYGSPAIPYNNYLRSYSAFRKLPDMRKQLAMMEKRIKELEEGKE